MRFSGESRSMTTCRTSLFYREFCPYDAVLRQDYNRITAVLQSTYGNPDRAMAGGGAGGEADARRSGQYGRRAS